jgi:uncharacterized membrane protein YeaQ/YmgE (transglycosylase-associated protein family)
MGFMWLLWTIVIGILAGWIAGHIVKGRGMGLAIDLLVGIVGAVLGGWIFSLIGLAAYGLIGRLVMAVVGACLLLLLVRVLKRA